MEGNNIIGKFIGQRIIKSVSPYTDEAVIVGFEDNYEEIISIHMIDKIVSGESFDSTSLQNKRVELLAEKILELLKKYNAHVSELNQTLSTVTLSIDDSFYKSNDILWRTGNRTMLDIDRVLKSEKMKLSDIIKDVDK